MAWPEIQKLGGCIRKFRLMGNFDDELESGLALIVGEGHSLDLAEAAAFGFIETDKGAPIVSASDLPSSWGSGTTRVFVVPKATFLLSELVKFAPGFDRSMIVQNNPPTVNVTLDAIPPVSPVGTIEHAGYKIYTSFRRNDPGKTLWLVQSQDNKEKGVERGFGDTIHQTLIEAEKAAEGQALDDEWKRDIAAQEDVAKAAADAKVEANRSLSIGQRKANAVLAKNVNIKGKLMTLREAVEMIVKRGGELETEEVAKIKPMSRMAYFRATQHEQDAHEKRMKEAGNKTIYYVGNLDLGKTAYDYAVLLKNATAKEAVAITGNHELAPAESPSKDAAQDGNANIANGDRVSVNASLVRGDVSIFPQDETGQPSQIAIRAARVFEEILSQTKMRPMVTEVGSDYVEISTGPLDSDERVMTLRIPKKAVNKVSATENIAEPAPTGNEVIAEPLPAKGKAKITDAGIKIGRARKDFYSRRIVGSDAADMTESERTTFIRKTKLWVYSPSEARANGVEYGVAEFTQKLRLNMPEFDVIGKPSNGDPLKLESYIDFCNQLQGHLHVGIKNKHQLFDSLTQLHADPVFKDTLKKIIYGAYGSRDFKRMRKFAHIIENVPRVSRGREDMLLDELTPSELFLYGYTDVTDMNPSPYDDESDTEYKKSYMDNLWGKLCKTRKTQPAETTEVTNKAQKPDRPHLDNLQNAWVKKNPDGSVVNVTAQDLIERFGFKGVEFGEWLPQDERQTVLNETYAACTALVEVLGMPDRMASLDGELSIAFGSRGKGKAAAHFEPDLWVYNLTRMNGAGSMAHEWGHAADYRLADISSGLGKHGTACASLCETVPALTTFISEEEWRERSDAARQDGEHDKVLRGAMQMVRIALEKSVQPEQTLDDLQAVVGKHLDYAVSWIVDWGKEDGAVKMVTVLREVAMHIYGLEADDQHLPEVKHCAMSSFNFADRSKIRIVDGQHSLSAYDTINKSIKYILSKLEQTGCVDKTKLSKARNSRNFESNLRTAFNNLHSYRRYLVSPDKADPVKSQFLREAEQLDKSKSKPYFATGKELFARAFECYVFDKLCEAGMPCDYLVHSVEGSKFADKGVFTGNPYPSGSERQQINEAMARLFDIASKHATGYEESVSQPARLRA